MVGGTVECIFKDVFRVKHDNGSSVDYTYDGKFDKNDVSPILFWNEIEFEVPECKKKLPEIIKKYIKPTKKNKNIDYDLITFNYESTVKKWECHYTTYRSAGQILFEEKKNVAELMEWMNKQKVTIYEFEDALKQLGWL